jgi:hypothetical protein
MKQAESKADYFFFLKMQTEYSSETSVSFTVLHPQIQLLLLLM